jgi:hypothetical protein
LYFYGLPRTKRPLQRHWFIFPYYWGR